MMRYTRIGLILALGALIYCQTVKAAGTATLADANPQDGIFHAMTWSGLRGYAAVEKRLPANLEVAAAAGYFPYALPSSNHLQYFLAGNVGRLSTGGSISANNVPQDGFVVEVRVHEGAPVELEQVPFKNPATGKVELQTYIDEKVPGGQWLADGKTPQQVADALRVQRIRQHLHMLAGNYQQQHSRLPGGIGQLEEFQGVKRNAAGWQGITIVTTPGAVETMPLSVFAGRINSHPEAPGPAFLIKVNVGFTTQESGVFITKNGSYGFFGDGSYSSSRAVSLLARQSSTPAPRTRCWR